MVKRSWNIMAGAAVVALLAGCATTDPSQSKTRELHSERMASVDRVASRKGVTVVWINPPTRVRTRDIEYSTEITVERQ